MRLMSMLLLAAALASVPSARAQTDQQALVDRATLTVNELMTDGGPDVQSLLRNARAVLVCPRIFRGGFIVGGEGGSCVLAARGGAGTWSAPAFFGLASASIGFQIGIQDAQVMVFIMNDRALNAVLDSQFKFGADAGIAIATIGAGIEGATTAAAGADIVTFSRSRGLYAGISLSGSLLSARSDDNQAFYGRPLSPRQVVVSMEGNSAGADPLRQALGRHGTR